MGGNVGAAGMSDAFSQQPATHFLNLYTSYTWTYIHVHVRMHTHVHSHTCTASQLIRHCYPPARIKTVPSPVLGTVIDFSSHICLKGNQAEDIPNNIDKFKPNRFKNETGTS